MLKKTPAHAKVAAHAGVAEHEITRSHVLKALAEGAIDTNECGELLDALGGVEGLDEV